MTDLRQESALICAADGFVKAVCNNVLEILSFSERFADLVGIAQRDTQKEMVPVSAYIHPEDYIYVRKEIMAYAERKEPFSFQCRLRHFDGHDIYVKVNGAFSDELYEERYPVVYFVYTDITYLVVSKKIYREEIEYQSAVIGDSLLVKGKINLTRDVVEAYEGKEGVQLGLLGDTYGDAIKKIANTALTIQQREELLGLYNSERLIKEVKDGNNSFSTVYQRKTGFGVIWTEIVARVFINPENDDKVFFLYTYDINEVTMARVMIDRVVALDYDFISFVDLDKGTYQINSKSNADNTLETPNCGDYNSVIASYAEQCLVEDDRKSTLQAMSLDVVRRKLKEKESYSVYFRMYNLDREILYKKICFSYLNKEQQIVLMTRSDVTEIYQKEQMHKEELKDALAAAQQANHAKTEFLSRMSHEIRTPMNAIIGMSALAAQSVNDPEQVADCLSKVGISARYLLSLINDILDMSRIESGKMFVRQEEIPFEEFINGINAICYEQAAAKDIDYDSVITSFTEAYYIGDAMKLQQIILNLLSNAIKFTPPGGKVQLIVSQEKVVGDKAHLKFIVNDTGVGISEEFLPNIFNPFEQQHTGITTMYGGTGLGLAICKNLISLMDGSIHVTSIEGIGTEFTVEVKLGISEKVKKIAKIKSSINFALMSALIVDDDVMICQHTEYILKEMGMNAQWVDSGGKAIKMVTDKWAKKDYYDVIFIDWKMPDMDGIETTKQIRKIVGPNVTIIIITAYDWSSIEQEAKMAGANMLISKPLFKSSLSSTFEKIYTQRQTEHTDSQEKKVYDFTGKRVLLVEDHMLNIEVARNLLELKNMAVEVAENGLKALETFVTSPTEHFDAILMDVRMPVMDGLTAAKSIRQLRHPNARNIPIIAMTANAFDEDVDRTKAAGMDAHLAKPINPQLLYETLSNFLFTDK